MKQLGKIDVLRELGGTGIDYHPQRHPYGGRYVSPAYHEDIGGTAPLEGSGVWGNRQFTISFFARIEILYLTRKDVEEQFKAGQISKEDYDRYWKKSKAEHLEEVAILVPRNVWERALNPWISTWRHKGGGYYEKEAFAVRSGGVNQSQDPLNVFLLKE